MFHLVTNRKAPDRKIRGFFKVHVHFTCIFLSFYGLLTVWSVSVSGCIYCRCPGAVLSKVVELAGVETTVKYLTETAETGYQNSAMIT
jgi:hypothetical protein